METIDFSYDFISLLAKSDDYNDNYYEEDCFLPENNFQVCTLTIVFLCV